jgi:hypothetical protein
MIQAYKDYANNLRLGDHSLARLAAREYNELLAELGGPEQNPGERYLSMGMSKRPGEQFQVVWDQIADALSLSQYKKTMGLRTYKAKALMVRDHVSKSRKIQALCNKLIQLIDANETEVRESLKAVSRE